MESSKLFGGAEECHSSESGWTMYLGSHIHGDDDLHSYDDDDDDDGGNGKNYYHEDDDSDDSMASDASSGPSHQGTDFKLQKDADGKYQTQRKPNNKQVEKQQQKAERRRKEENKDQEVGFMARRAYNKSAPAQSSSKVRKSISWMGKEK
ncbi:hypothetical protein P3X46_002812 [Hevea brasiliensis]|uniref:Uncharacterized protein n=1 Tax=Hevea brasiliensis TaxID=3981 RepID=A0ABQ9N6G3_HEVBR|nr:protein SUPPRESSOR OF PHYTOCHROME B 5 [Hevea brasiliensis]KAJ9187348.1 hypothetical protein P3X46_002812 [Hevea brasiliensis]